MPDLKTFKSRMKRSHHSDVIDELDQTFQVLLTLKQEIGDLEKNDSSLRSMLSRAVRLHRKNVFAFLRKNPSTPMTPHFFDRVGNSSSFFPV